MSVYGLTCCVKIHASANGLYPLPYPGLELWVVVSCVGCWVTVSGHKWGGVQHWNLHRYVLCLKQCRIVRTGEMPPAARRQYMFANAVANSSIFKQTAKPCMQQMLFQVTPRDAGAMRRRPTKPYDEHYAFAHRAWAQQTTIHLNKIAEHWAYNTMLSSKRNLHEWNIIQMQVHQHPCTKSSFAKQLMVSCKVTLLKWEWMKRTLHYQHEQY